MVSLAAPDGFPFSVRVPIEVDRAERRLRLGGAPVGVPWQPGLACVTAHDHAPDFSWQRNFQVRGDLVNEGGSWAVIPHRLIGGFELPPASTFERYRQNGKKVMRFRKIARREMRNRDPREERSPIGDRASTGPVSSQGAESRDGSPLTP